MTPSTMALLDQTELLKLALDASGSGNAGDAIAYLKEAVGRPDGTAIGHYLLGAEYAQIKLYDRAVDQMEAALALDPKLSTARLQLGLLWLTSGAADRAAQVFTPLLDLPHEEALHLFGKGLIALCHDQADDAVDALQAGIARNTSNPALNGDMQHIIDEVGRLRAGGAPGGAPAAPVEADAAAAQDSHHVLLSAYTGNTQN